MINQILLIKEHENLQKAKTFIIKNKKPLIIGILAIILIVLFIIVLRKYKNNKSLEQTKDIKTQKDSLKKEDYEKNLYNKKILTKFLDFLSKVNLDFKSEQDITIFQNILKECFKEQLKEENKVNGKLLLNTKCEMGDLQYSSYSNFDTKGSRKDITIFSTPYFSIIIEFMDVSSDETEEKTIVKTNKIQNCYILKKLWNGNKDEIKFETIESNPNFSQAITEAKNQSIANIDKTLKNLEK